MGEKEQILEDWENILKNEGLGKIDKEKDENGNNKFYFDEEKDKIKNILNIDKLNFLESIKYIENQYQINIEINNQKQYISLYSNENELIGEIGISELSKFDLKNHLRIKIDKGFRGKGYGNILLELYKKGIEERGYLLPEYDYVRKKSLISFLYKLGYKLESQILDDKSEKFLSEKEINTLYKKGNIDNTNIWYKMILEIN